MELTTRSKLEKEGIGENSEFDNLGVCLLAKSPQGIKYSTSKGPCLCFLIKLDEIGILVCIDSHSF
jgi:hypothetical protein